MARAGLAGQRELQNQCVAHFASMMTRRSKTVDLQRTMLQLDAAAFVRLGRNRLVLRFRQAAPLGRAGLPQIRTDLPYRLPQFIWNVGTVRQHHPATLQIESCGFHCPDHHDNLWPAVPERGLNPRNPHGASRPPQP